MEPPDPSDDVTVPAPSAPVAAPSRVDERARRAAPTMPPVGPRSSAPQAGVEPAFEPAIPERLPNLVFLACAALAVLVVLVGGGLGVQACSDRLAEAVDARTTLIAVLVGLAWLLGGTVVAVAIAVLGRAAAGILLVARKLDERRRG